MHSAPLVLLLAVIVALVRCAENVPASSARPMPAPIMLGLILVSGNQIVAQLAPLAGVLRRTLPMGLSGMFGTERFVARRGTSLASL